MSKRPPGGPDSRQQHSEDIAGYKHAAYGGDHGDDAAGSDEVCNVHDRIRGRLRCIVLPRHRGQRLPIWACFKLYTLVVSSVAKILRLNLYFRVL